MFIGASPYKEKRCRTPLQGRVVSCISISQLCKCLKQAWQLALRVLWSLAGTLEAGFFAFLHARVACEETGSA